MKYYIQFPDKLVFLILFPTLFQELIDSKFEIQMMCIQRISLWYVGIQRLLLKPNLLGL